MCAGLCSDDWENDVVVPVAPPEPAPAQLLDRQRVPEDLKYGTSAAEVVPKKCVNTLLRSCCTSGSVFYRVNVCAWGLVQVLSYYGYGSVGVLLV